VKEEKKEEKEGEAEEEDPEVAKKKEEAKKRKYEKKKQMVKTEWFANDDHAWMYITGLPDDITDDELATFMKKAGMIKEDEFNGGLKLKVYRDNNDMPKGDAKCCYLKTASIDVAEQILDGAELRPGVTVNVQKAKFEQKSTEYVAWKPTKKKNKKKKKTDVLSQESALGWEEFRTDTGGRILIIKNVFDKANTAEEGFVGDLRDDMEAECRKKGGEVEKVTVFPDHPEAVVAVKFKKPESAEKMRIVMDGRWFSQRQLSADLYDGKTDYSVGKKKETIEEQQARLEAFGAELENSGSAEEQKAP